MPSRIPKTCTWPACGALVHDGTSRCPQHAQHARRESEARRDKTYLHLYGRRWKKASAAWRAKHPLCAEHERLGEVVTGNVVDHKIAHRGDVKLFWDPGNWQTLCTSCHNRKTAAEDGGFGNRRA